MPYRDPAAFLEALLEASPVGVVAVDKSGRVQLWSRGAQRILGWTEDEVIGRAPFPKGQLPHFPDENPEACLIGKDGTAMYVDVRTVPWKEGTLAILTDISRDRCAQREIRDLIEREQEARTQARAESRFRELLEAAPDAIIEVDREGRIVILNQVTEKMFGYRRDELLGRGMEVLLPEELRAIHVKHRAHYWTHPVTRPMGAGLTLHGQRKDGSSFPVEISLSPVKAEDGFRVTAIIRDITDRKQAENRIRALREDYTSALEARNREIEQANLLKSEFLANMSHELRTPLHTVIGFAELLMEEMKGPLNEDQKRFVNHIHKDAQHLLALINEVLDLSKIEAGKLELHREQLNIGSVLDDALSSIRPQASTRSIDIETCVPSPIYVHGDRLRVKQVLYNLLSNAIKFTPEKGQVRVKVAAFDGFAQVSVRDTGIGIPPEEQESVFDKFRQVSGGKESIREGTGLGLAITRRLVEEHGGRIWLDSEPGRGSSFTFTIPLVRANEKSVGSGR